MRYEPKQKVRVKRNLDYNDEALLVLKINNYVLTIASVHPSKDEDDDGGFYRVKEFEHMAWKEEYIECLYEEIIIDPIHSRFEILDL